MPEADAMNPSMNPGNASRDFLARALRQVLPITLGYIPVGFAYGVLAQKNGLSAANTLLMSCIVFAGSAQLIAVGLFASGAGLASIVATTFIVNLRHLLMSAALSPFLRAMAKWRIALFCFELTDETFALHANRFHDGNQDQAETFAINVLAQLSWIAGTALGVFSSTLIGDVRPLGLDYALPAMFIALLMAQIRHRAHVLVALVSAALSLGLFALGLDQWHVILATVCGATLGLGVHAWISDTSS